MASCEFVAETERKCNVPWKDQKGETVHITRRFVNTEDGKVTSESIERFNVPRSSQLARLYPVWMCPEENRPADRFKDPSEWWHHLKVLGVIRDGMERMAAIATEPPLSGQPSHEFVTFTDKNMTRAQLPHPEVKCLKCKEMRTQTHCRKKGCPNLICAVCVNVRNYCITCAISEDAEENERNRRQKRIKKQKKTKTTRPAHDMHNTHAHKQKLRSK